ncbi:hypothetical protein AVEN_246406-1 [Araneus ventricosus]|uniref:Uncharacterized protein n=1 Tax=Araneus ventricosus TaxID=182803 RepID=A0A4Y2LKK8_ARAVE|nr:hypothetical protein AVEN_246406-1 [Araneus ventricosus]
MFASNKQLPLKRSLLVGNKDKEKRVGRVVHFLKNQELFQSPEHTEFRDYLNMHYSFCIWDPSMLSFLPGRTWLFKSSAFFVTEYLNLLNDSTTEIDGCSPQEFTISKQANILQKESRSHQAILHVQSSFCAPSFLICTAHFCACITILTALIVEQNSYAHFTALSAFCLHFFNSSGGLLACLWMAGGPSTNKFKEAFERKIRDKKLSVRCRFK